MVVKVPSGAAKNATYALTAIISFSWLLVTSHNRSLSAIRDPSQTKTLSYLTLLAYLLSDYGPLIFLHRCSELFTAISPDSWLAGRCLCCYAASGR